MKCETLKEKIAFYKYILGGIWTVVLGSGGYFFENFKRALLNSFSLELLPLFIIPLIIFAFSFLVALLIVYKIKLLIDKLELCKED